MSFLKDKFNHIGSRTKSALTYAFTAAALSKPGQVFVQEAGLICGLSFVGGDLLLGVNYTDVASILIAADGFLAISDFRGLPAKEILPSRPVGNWTRFAFEKIAPHGVRIAGVCSLYAATSLGYQMRNDPGFKSLIVSCSIIALQAGSMIFEDQFNALSEKLSHARSKILSTIFKYPIVSTSVLDIGGKALMAYGAVQSKDWNLLTATFLWPSAATAA